MSFITLKNEFKENLLVCRACLSTNRKLYSLHQDDILMAYKNLMRCEVTPYDTLPQYICNHCCIILLKYNRFKDNCQKIKDYLENARLSYKNITTADLNNFAPHIHYQKSETKLLSIPSNNNETENTTPALKTDENEYSVTYDDNNQYETDTENINIYTETIPQYTDIENHKIYAETVPIKTENETDIEISQNKRHTSTRKKNTKKIDTVKKKGKYFETNENMRDFESAYDVDITVLTEEQQMKDVLERKSSSNYLHNPYKCELCFKGYMGADILEKHFLSQHDPSRGNVVCNYCQFRYKDRRGLNQHLKSHRLKFSCRQCTYVSRTTFNAKEHFKMHGGRLHQCRHCGKSYEKLSSHLSHLRIQHPSEFIWCDICGEAFIGKFGLNAHKKRAHRNLSLECACAWCSARLSSAAALQCHSSRACCAGHSCVHCGEGFDEALELREHLLKMHRKSRVFSCEKCNKTFSRESLYSAHYRRIHVDKKYKDSRKQEIPWICEICGKILPNKCVLLYHQRNHTGEKPYHCTLCPKKFTMKKLLQSHLRVHTSDRPYKCKLCPKAFKGLSALRAHENVHKGVENEKTNPS